jgi:hypothetical protein
MQMVFLKEQKKNKIEAIYETPYEAHSLYGTINLYAHVQGK